ncbi:MAG TPA: SDR family NAD(P)-dependent oxidoreductase, partial [Rubrobacter sp.]|nr:SDR family NAD(P)-dependent oxidoreductase [Rubrobacter sp.]
MDNQNIVMGGKTVLITGGTSGIGKATALALAAMGANVVISGRNAERAERAMEEIKGQSHNQSVDLILADLSVQSEVRRLAEAFLARHDSLDVLANNAGLVLNRRTETPDGIETTLAINHLAPFLLTNLLLDRLRESAPARIVTTSS